MSTLRFVRLAQVMMVPMVMAGPGGQGFMQQPGFVPQQGMQALARWRSCGPWAIITITGKGVHGTRVSGDIHLLVWAEWRRGERRPQNAHSLCLAVSARVDFMHAISLERECHSACLLTDRDILRLGEGSAQCEAALDRVVGLVVFCFVVVSTHAPKCGTRDSTLRDGFQCVVACCVVMC